MNPQVLCLDGLASDDDHEDRSSDAGDEAGVFQDPMPTVVSVRPEVTEKWMDRFVIDLVECPSVSRTSAVPRTFGPTVSEVVRRGGGGVATDTCPLVGVESDAIEVSVLHTAESDRAQISVLPVAGTPGRFFLGRSPFMQLAWALARRVSQWIRFGGSFAEANRRASPVGSCCPGSDPGEEVGNEIRDGWSTGNHEWCGKYEIRTSDDGVSLDAIQADV